MADVKSVANPQVQTGMIVIAIFCYKIAEYVLKYLFDKFWKKTVETDYVTIEQCKECREEMEAKMQGNMDKTNELLSTINISIQNLTNFFIGDIVNSDKLTDEEKTESIIKLTSKGKS